MERLVARCGLVCTDCPSYIATQADDREQLAAVVEAWRKQYNAPHLTVDAITCDGCLAIEGRHCSHCFQCKIRACAIERGLQNCAACADYACEHLEALFAMAPEARAVLDEIRRVS